MEVREMKTLKATLEKEIKDLIEKFQIDTDLTVDGIFLTHIPPYSGGFSNNDIVYVTVKATI